MNNNKPTPVIWRNKRTGVSIFGYTGPIEGTILVSDYDLSRYAMETKELGAKQGIGLGLFIGFLVSGMIALGIVKGKKKEKKDKWEKA